MKVTGKPFILTAFLCLAEIYCILSFNLPIPVFITFSIVSSAVISFFFIRKKEYISAILCTLLLIFSCLNPYFLLNGKENAAKELFLEIKDEKDIIYTAEVLDFNDYGSYSTSFGILTHKNGKKLDTPFKVRLGSHSDSVLEKGDVITFKGKGQFSRDVRSDDFNTALYLRSKSAFLDFSSAEILSSERSEKVDILSNLRKHTRKTFYRYIPKGFDFGAVSVCYAMFTGDKDYVSRDLSLAFRDSGLSHLLCVSGLHLMIISGALYALLSVFTVGKKTKCFILIGFCILYSAFTGFAISTVRTCIMSCMAFTALTFSKRTDGFSCLFLTALAICTFSPYSIFDISAQLSFCASFGIILVNSLLPRINESARLSKKLFCILIPIITSIGAFTFTLPVSAYYFGTISIYSIAATLIASPFCSALLTCLLLLTLLSPIGYIPFAEPILYFLGSICRILASVTVGISEFFSSFRFSNITSSFTDEFLIIYCILLFVITVFIAMGKRRFVLIFTAILILSSTLFSLSSLIVAIRDDAKCKISYHRKNENDRLLSVKLGTLGYLLINADNRIIDGSSSAKFDSKSRNNYLLIIPDEVITPSILAGNINYFKENYGLRKIFLPDNHDGFILSKELSNLGIETYIFPKHFNYNDISIEFLCEEFYSITIDDKEKCTSIVFAEHYEKGFFPEKADICAFFTRKTKNQFDKDKNAKPSCDIFFTRMKKDDFADGITNTFSKKDFFIKE